MADFDKTNEAVLGADVSATAEKAGKMKALAEAEQNAYDELYRAMNNLTLDSIHTDFQEGAVGELKELISTHGQESVDSVMASAANLQNTAEAIQDYSQGD